MDSKVKPSQREVYMRAVLCGRLLALSAAACAAGRSAEAYSAVPSYSDVGGRHCTLNRVENRTRHRVNVLSLCAVRVVRVSRHDDEGHLCRGVWGC